ncbi:TPA: hypothetical protein P0E23_002802 [Vibrio harveyi]|uniref:hypothetical protein n=1 Tax=Vibrio TaxID=662 RepID=UPI000685A3F9|nr:MULTISPECIES: hypothetical protein [Vibrio]HDM8170182.1 hypothetical protein [Vibrio harveyi]
MPVDDCDLFIASDINSMEDFLKTALSNNKRIHCTFSYYNLDMITLRELKKRKISSITFTCGKTILFKDVFMIKENEKKLLTLLCDYLSNEMLYCEEVLSKTKDIEMVLPIIKKKIDILDRFKFPDFEMLNTEVYELETKRKEYLILLSRFL